MAGKFIPKDDLPFVETVAHIAYCNHFLKERIDLEKEALGSDYKEDPRDWNINPVEPRRSPNLISILERSKEIIEKCRNNIIRNKGGDTRELKIYFDFVYFTYFHEFVEEYDEIITYAYKNRRDPDRIEVYDSFKEVYNHYFNPGSVKLETEYSCAHLFACFSQIRRAFYHIFLFIIGASPAAMQLRSRVWQSIFTHDMERYQKALYNRMGDIITLITGPSGTGKELVAQALGLSRFIPFDEKKRQFHECFIETYYPLNLSALSTTLIESELFGHRKGAFTGALEDRKGYLEVCGPYGTIFLDEIGDVSSDIQVKLLRVLQTRKFQRLCDTKTLEFSGKIMGATNRDLVSDMKSGHFRKDLYYRMCADRIETLALKDILAVSPDECYYLVLYIAKKVAGEEVAEKLSKEVCAWIEKKLGRSYPWQGNFRELEQCVCNILIHHEYHPDNPDSDDFAAQFEDGTLTAEEVLSRYVTRVYSRTNNYEETARRVGLDRRTIKKYIDQDVLDKFSENFKEIKA